ncbi:hypothetical protein NEIMUCOT_03742 [Neisseria mucosa ATCC 25996]|uniref:Uncharacterized protein n=1 Tax=Neisseria mucosa (strain ATCC 25996 / DSM 4631 / NCTC 10774 / M26) TaxID=546266 RepID=D2ZT09_NEIM2|nr:hypothetical protein NEIMUCOT_03742 [Neisseria mucosa ATCC 25996]
MACHVSRQTPKGRLNGGRRYLLKQRGLKNDTTKTNQKPVCQTYRRFGWRVYRMAAACYRICAYRQYNNRIFETGYRRFFCVPAQARAKAGQQVQTQPMLGRDGGLRRSTGSGIPGGIGYFL